MAYFEVLLRGQVRSGGAWIAKSCVCVQNFLDCNTRVRSTGCKEDPERGGVFYLASSCDQRLQWVDPIQLTAIAAPWARDPPVVLNHGNIQIRELSASEKRREFLILIQNMTPRSAAHVGDIHRYLCQTPNERTLNDIRGELMKKLGKKTMDALKYVCVDLNLMPAGTATKEMCAQQLVEWVSVLL